MRFVPYHEFIQLPERTPFIPVGAGDVGLMLRGQVINGGADFYCQVMAEPDFVAATFETPSLAGGMFAGAVPDNALETTTARDGAFDDERSFLVLDTLDSRVCYLNNISELLNLHELSLEDKKKVIEAFSADLLSTHVETPVELPATSHFDY